MKAGARPPRSPGPDAGGTRGRVAGRHGGGARQAAPADRADRSAGVQVQERLDGDVLLPVPVAVKPIVAVPPGARVPL
jgi:hypothetical protein